MGKEFDAIDLTFTQAYTAFFIEVLIKASVG